VSRSHQDSPASLRLLGVCLDAASLSLVLQSLKAWPNVRFGGNLPHYLVDKSDLALLQRSAEPLPDIVLVDFDQSRERAASTAEHLQDLLQGRSAIFAVSSEADPDLIIGAMRSGCSEYLVKPLKHDRLAQAVAKIEGKKKEKERVRKSGKLITLLGAKGGAGVTTIGVHLSTFMAKLSDQRILLIDQHPDLGDAALYLSIEKPPYSFYELAGNVHRLDSNLVQGFVSRHSSGLDVLASPAGFDAAVAVQAHDLEFTLDFLKTIYDVIVIDCPPGLSGLNLSAVQKSDELWLIATPDVPSVRNLCRYLEHLSRFNYPADAVKVLINRHSRRDPVSKEDIARTLKKQILLTVPNSYAEVMEALNTGTPISPGAKSEFSAVLRRWAEAMARGASGLALAQEEPKRRFGILGL
jgi:pilus assembly protein CpaE